MNISDLRDMNDEQLEATMRDTSQQLFRLRLQAHTERLDVPSELKRNRRLIARIKTVQTEREIAKRQAAESSS